VKPFQVEVDEVAVVDAVEIFDKVDDPKLIIYLITTIKT
jgi:hypothetical protein